MAVAENVSEEQQLLQQDERERSKRAPAPSGWSPTHTPSEWHCAPPLQLVVISGPSRVDEWWVVIGWRDQRMQSHQSLTGSTTPQHYAMQYSTTVNSSPQNWQQRNNQSDRMRFWGFRFSLVASGREETEFRVCCWVVVWMSGTADSALTSVWSQTIWNLLAFGMSGSWCKAQVKDLFGVWVSHNTQLL